MFHWISFQIVSLGIDWIRCVYLCTFYTLTIQSKSSTIPTGFYMDQLDFHLWTELIYEYIKQPWFRQKHVTAGYKYKYKCRSWSKITKEYFLPLVMWKGWGTMGCWSAHPRVHVSCKLTRDLFQVRHVYEVKWSITSRNMSLCHSHTPTFGIAPIIWNNDSSKHIWNNVHLTSLYCSQKWTDKLTKQKAESFCIQTINQLTSI